LLEDVNPKTDIKPEKKNENKQVR